MADATGPTTTPKGGSKLSQFIKKNKTLSAVIGLGGLYFLYKETTKGASEGGAEVAGEQEGGGGSPGYPTGSLSNEGTDEEIHRVEEETREEKREREEHERENENKEGGEPAEPAEPGGGGTGIESPAPEAPEPVGPEPSSGLTVNGKVFTGAIKSEIVGSGQSNGGKKWIEYLITFPGRQQHWRYFTATGNWSQVKDSGNGPASGKPATSPKGEKTANPPPKTPPTNKPVYVAKIGDNKALPAPKSKPGKTGGGGAPTQAPAQNAQGGAPQNNAQHPSAVNTGNKCVNGGIGGHTPPNPSTEHLFCQGGWIWRAPNA